MLIILLIVVLIFGTKRLKGMGADIGGFIKGLRGALSGDSDDGETKKRKSLTEDKKPADSDGMEEGVQSTNSEDEKATKEKPQVPSQDR